MLRFLTLCLFFTFSITISYSQPPTAEKIAQAREFFNTGVKKGIDKNFDAAIEDFTRAIALNPLFAEAFLYKGLAEIEIQNYDQAVKDFTITIELDPSFSDQAHYFRGLTRYYLGEYALAIDDYSIAIRMNPDFVSFFQRGKANLKLEEYRRALQDFDIALRLNEEFYEAYLYRGICMYHLEMYDQARADLDIAGKKFPATAEVHYYSGLVSMAMKTNTFAIESFDKAIGLNPEFNEAHRAREMAQERAGIAPTPIQSNGRQSAQQIPAQSTRETNPQRPIAQVARQQQPASGSPSHTEGMQPTLYEQSPADIQDFRPSSTDIDFAELFAASKREQPKEEPQITQVTQPATGQIAPPVANRPIIISELPSGIYNKDLEQKNLSGFGVQIASYSSTSNLLSLTDAYAQQYLKPVFINVSVVNGRTLYKIIIGHFDNRSEAETFRNELRSDSFPDSFLVLFENL
jgi:tetratricopeptide (TPR) repeat protein